MSSATKSLSDFCSTASSRTANSATSPPAAAHRAFSEIGLPFEADTAVTRHLAAFLSRTQGEGAASRARRTCCSTAACSRPTRFASACSTCSATGSPTNAPEVARRRTTTSTHAVARGAAYYGWAKQRGGVRIRGGTARSYYVGIETAGLAIPGAPRPLRALCVVPFGMEEGTEADVPGERNRRSSSASRRTSASSAPRCASRTSPATCLSRWTDDELAETDSLEATLPADEASRGGLRPRPLPIADHRARRVRTLVRQHRQQTNAGNWNSASATTWRSERLGERRSGRPTLQRALAGGRGVRRCL